MTKKEIFICQLTFGGYPVSKEDQLWAISTKLYQEKAKEFEEGKFKELWEYELNKNKQK